jgi:antitoxin VapB
MYILLYIFKVEVVKMLTTKVFTSGNSQAIRLPKEYQVDDKELFIQKIGNTIILFPCDDPWDAFEQSLSQFSEDFFSNGRQQPEMQERDSF